MITSKQFRALSWAVKNAESLRGLLTGNPDTAQLEAFDQKILTAKQALVVLSREYKQSKGTSNV